MEHTRYNNNNKNRSFWFFFLSCPTETGIQEEEEEPKGKRNKKENFRYFCPAGQVNAGRCPSYPQYDLRDDCCFFFLQHSPLLLPLREFYIYLYGRSAPYPRGGKWSFFYDSFFLLLLLFCWSRRSISTTRTREKNETVSLLSDWRQKEERKSQRPFCTRFIQ